MMPPNRYPGPPAVRLGWERVGGPRRTRGPALVSRLQDTNRPQTRASVARQIAFALQGSALQTGFMKEAGSKERSGSEDGLETDSRNLLVKRVASGPAFGRSCRLRELFLFLCNRKSADPGGGVREHEIGIEVFGR